MDESQANGYGPPFPWSVEKTRAYTRAFNRRIEVKGHYAQRALIRVLLWFFQALSAKGAYRAGAWLGKLLYLLRVRSRVALTNLDIVFGDKKTKVEKERIYRDALINFGRLIITYARLPFMEDKKLIENFPIRNEHIARECYNEGKGAVIIGGHIGIWDLAAARIGMAGYPISIVAKRQPNEVADQLIVDLRERVNLGSIMHKESMARIREGMRHGEGIIMALDQNMKLNQGVFVSFLGRVASTVRSNAWVQRETGAPCFCGYAYQTGPDQYELVFTERVPWEPHPEDPEKELLVNTRRQAEAVEKVIYEHPELWFWLHRRWKVQPDGVPNPYK
jgi:KDO2-lipid IV(A) lauroyltransferase